MALHLIIGHYLSIIDECYRPRSHSDYGDHLHQ